jgi:hypothetical protein
VFIARAAGALHRVRLSNVLFAVLPRDCGSPPAQRTRPEIAFAPA